MGGKKTKQEQPALDLQVIDLAAARDFRLKEYDRVSSELLSQLEEAWRLEKFAIGGSAALVAWLITNPVPVTWAWLLPFFFVLACAIRFVAAMCHIVFRLGKYIKSIEHVFIGKSGWESWFRRKKLNQTIAHSLLWIALIVPLAGLAFKYRLQNPIREHYKVASVANGATSAMAIKNILEKESKDGWTLVTTYNSSVDEVLVFNKKW